MKKLLYLIFFPFCLLHLSGCSNDECTDTSGSLPLAEFYSAEDKKPISIDSLAVWAIDAPGETMLLDSVRSAEKTWLPFNLDTNYTTFVFCYLKKEIPKPEMNDTLKISYNIQPWFISTACGAIYRYKINEIIHTSHFIDSVSCTASDNIIDNKPGKNFCIYFK